MQRSRSPDSPSAEQQADGRPKYKSWRKKYRKIRVVYDRKSRESDDLCKMELKATATIRRLAEENNQLLEFLLDYNELETVRPRNLVNLAVDTADPKPTKASKTLDHERIPTPPPEANVPDDGSPSRVALQHAHASTARARHIAKLIQDEKESPKELVALLHVPHSRSVALASTHMSEELCASPNPPTYLTTALEDDHLDATDKALASRSSSALNAIRSSFIPGSVAKPHMSQAERDREEEREVALRNPVSVYNWLRRNQPQVFLQDKEAGLGDKTNGGKADTTPSEKAAAATTTTSKPARGTAKRASSAANKSMADAPPLEYMDDDGVLHGGAAETSTPVAAAAAAAASGSKGKRKREEDPGYRPKGGSSSRPSKKKKKSGGGKTSGKGDRDRDHDGDDVGMDSPAADVVGGSSTAKAVQGSGRSKKAAASSSTAAGRRSGAHARASAAAAGDL